MSKSLMATYQEGVTIFVSNALGYVKEERPATKDELIKYDKEIKKSLELSKQGRFNGIDLQD